MKQFFLFLFISSIFFTTFAALNPTFADNDKHGFFEKWFDFDDDDDDDDDDDHWKNRKPATNKEYSTKKSRRNLRPISEPLYSEECGSCHFAYQPELLPKKSWEKIFAGLEQHFGEDASLEEAEIKKLKAYVYANSAETSRAKKAQKLLRSLHGKTPLRITEIPYFVHEHDEIKPSRIQQENIKSIANCNKCHTTAESGSYRERHIKVPRP